MVTHRSFAIGLAAYSYLITDDVGESYGRQSGSWPVGYFAISSILASSPLMTFPMGVSGIKETGMILEGRL